MGEPPKPCLFLFVQVGVASHAPQHSPTWAKRSVFIARVREGFPEAPERKQKYASACVATRSKTSGYHLRRKRIPRYSLLRPSLRDRPPTPSYRARPFFIIMSSVCSRCRNLHLREHLVNDSTPFRVGDILELKESVHTVIYTRILNEAATAKRPAGQSSSPLPAIWDEPDYSKLKGRPAVLMQLPGHRADAWPKVCLLATFRASSVRGWLPDILQHFCAAVHLHDMIAEEPDLYHAHTRPEWTPERSGRPNGWLIACSFSSKGHIQGRWQNRQRANPSSNSSFTVGAEDELMELVAVCVEKWLDWQQECAINRDAYKTYRADYEVRPTRDLDSLCTHIGPRYGAKIHSIAREP